MGQLTVDYHPRASGMLAYIRNNNRTLVTLLLTKTASSMSLTFFLLLASVVDNASIAFQFFSRKSLRSSKQTTY